MEGAIPVWGQNLIHVQKVLTSPSLGGAMCAAVHPQIESTTLNHMAAAQQSGPASLPSSCGPSPVRLACLTPSRRLVEGRRRTWVVESTDSSREVSTGAMGSRVSEWTQPGDGSDSDCESEGPESPIDGRRSPVLHRSAPCSSAWERLMQPVSIQTARSGSPRGCMGSPFSSPDSKWPSPEKLDGRD